MVTVNGLGLKLRYPGYAVWRWQRVSGSAAIARARAQMPHCCVCWKGPTPLATCRLPRRVVLGMLNHVGSCLDAQLTL